MAAWRSSTAEPVVVSVIVGPPPPLPTRPGSEGPRRPGGPRGTPGCAAPRARGPGPRLRGRPADGGALVCRPVLRPHGGDQAHGILGRSPSVTGGEPVVLGLLAVPARAHAEDQAAFGEEVQRGHGLGQSDGIVLGG